MIDIGYFPGGSIQYSIGCLPRSCPISMLKCELYLYISDTVQKNLVTDSIPFGLIWV